MLSLLEWRVNKLIEQEKEEKEINHRWRMKKHHQHKVLCFEISCIDEIYAYLRAPELVNFQLVSKLAFFEMQRIARQMLLRMRVSSPAFYDFKTFKKMGDDNGGGLSSKGLLLFGSRHTRYASNSLKTLHFLTARDRVMILGGTPHEQRLDFLTTINNNNNKDKIKTELKWEEIEPLSYNKDLSPMVYHGGEIFSVSTHMSMLNELVMIMERFDIGSKKWLKVRAKLPHTYTGCSLAAADSIYLTGGLFGLTKRQQMLRDLKFPGLCLCISSLLITVFS